MTHPRSASGASPSRGRHQRPGKAGSAVVPALALRLHARGFTSNAVDR
jgi:hypothetical protein